MSQAAPTPRLLLSGGAVDLDAQTVQRGGIEVQLSPIEARLLAYMVEHAGRVLPQAELLEQVWGYAEGVQTRTVYSTVTRLRAKVEADPSQPVHVIAVPRRGYRFEVGQPGPRGNLPEGGEPMVGRTAELAAVVGLLEAGERLVTLVGPPGIGKTTLAGAAARAHGVHKPGGAWLCRLGRHGHPSELAVVVARALRVPLDEHSSDPVSAVGAALDALGPTLLLLDNCEESVAATRRTVARWLEQAPDLQLLLTSREPLGTSPEQQLRLEALDPDSAALLFRRRAQGGELDGCLSDRVEALVERVERIPLAIELAAGLVKLLGVDELARRLADSHQVLEARPVLRDGAPTTLAQAIARSWELLDADERQVLTACAVFRGSFDIPAAEAVAGPRALSCLARLVDKSLVVARGARLRLLESVREFAWQSGTDHDRVRTAHARWGEARLARDLAPPLRTEGLDGSIAVVEDLIAGLDWATQSDPALAVRIGLQLEELLAFRTIPGQRGRVLDQALAVAVEPADRLELLLRRSKVHRLAREFDASASTLDQAEALARSALDQARVLAGRGALAVLHFELDRARAVLEQAVDLAQQAGDDRLVAEARMVLGDVFRFLDRADLAREPLEQALATCEALEDEPGVANILPSLAWVEWDSGHRARALELLRRAIGLCQALGSRLTESRGHLTLCWFLLSDGRAGEAREELALARDRLRLAPGQWSAVVPVLEGLLLAEEGRLHDAVAALRLGEARCRQGGDPANVAVARLGIGLVRAALGDLDEARRTLQDTAAASRGWLADRATLLDRLVAQAQGEAQPWTEPASPRNQPLVLLGRAHLAPAHERRALLDQLDAMPAAATPEVHMARRLLGL